LIVGRPTLYDGRDSALVDQLARRCDAHNASTSCFLTHQDMLHEAPRCGGIAHDPERTTPYGHVYWLFDGRDGMLMRFDFQQPHGPGSLDHSRASVRRFPELKLKRVAGVVGHIAVDPDAASRAVYVADTGNGRVLRVDPDSGRFLRSAKREWPIYSSLAESFEYSVYGCTQHVVFASGLQQPSGIALDAHFVYVAEAGTGRVVAFDKASGARVQHVQTGARLLQGLTIDAQGSLWFADSGADRVGKLEVSAAARRACAARPVRRGVAALAYPRRTCLKKPVFESEAHIHETSYLAGYMNVTAALQTDYGTLRVEQCAGFNFDTLLMEVCL
jgi:hypothetical protein